MGKARSHRITPRELTCRFLERTVEILLANLIGAKLSLTAGQGEVIAIQLESSDPWMRIGETENRQTCFSNPGIKTGASWELSTAGDGLGGCWEPVRERRLHGTRPDKVPAGASRDYESWGGMITE